MSKIIGGTIMSADLCDIELENRDSVTLEMNVHGTLTITVYSHNSCYDNNITSISFQTKDVEYVKTLISALTEWTKHVTSEEI
jgi:hypothetical protein